MKDQVQQEILQINAQMYQLTERKKQIEIYLQGYQEAEAKSAELEKTLTDKIKELEGDKE